MIKGLRFFDWLRGYRKPEEPGVFKYVYEVNVAVDHPNVNGHLVTVPVRIDANSAEHARRQLHEKCRIVIGKAQKIGQRDTNLRYAEDAGS